MTDLRVIGDDYKGCSEPAENFDRHCSVAKHFFVGRDSREKFRTWGTAELRKLIRSSAVPTLLPPCSKVAGETPIQHMQLTRHVSNRRLLLMLHVARGPRETDG